MLLAATACGPADDGDGRGDAAAPTAAGTPATSGPSGRAEPGVLSGRVTDSGGRPLSGAVVVADRDQFADTATSATTGPDGRYRMRLDTAAATYHASASVTVRRDGSSFTMALIPSGDTGFSGREGAVVDFTWRLSGPGPDGRPLGSPVLFDVLDIEVPGAPGTPILAEDVRLTLTPAGPLLDGSEGRAVTRTGESTGDGDAVTDVPIARYRVTARYAPAGGPERPMLVRVRGTGAFAREVTADFRTVMSGVHRIELELRVG